MRLIMIWCWHLLNKRMSIRWMSFIWISSVGADASSPSFYLRTKGQVEQAIAGMGLKRATAVRPSLLLGAREEFRMGERLGDFIFAHLWVAAAQNLSPLYL